MPSARAREPQTRPRRVLISLYFVSLETTFRLPLRDAYFPEVTTVQLDCCTRLAGRVWFDSAGRRLR